MRILNVMFSRGLGGIEQCFVDYCEALKLQGHKVSAMIHPNAKIRESLLPVGVNITNVKNLGGWDFFAKAYIKKMLKQINPEVVIVHGNRAIDLVKNPAQRLGIKVVGVTHNYKNQRLVGLDGVFAITKDLQNNIIKKGQKPENVYLIPNMIKLPEMLPDAKNLNSPPIIGTMGRFVKKKGFHIFLEAIKILKDENVTFKAVLGGTGEEEASLKKLANDSDIANLVEFKGWVQDKEQFFNEIDIFCLPSLHEPFGIILLEAFAASKPVITSDSEGPREIATDQFDSLIYDKNYPEQLANAIKQLIENQPLCQRIAENAQNTVQNYSMQNVGALMNKALEKVCKK